MRFKRWLQKIPNLLSLLNLFLGCVAAIFVLQSTQIVLVDLQGYGNIKLNRIPGSTDLARLTTASFLVIYASIIDFFDGFVARALGAQTKIGEQLDSLSDMVTFGVVPGLMAYLLIALSYRYSQEALVMSQGPYYLGLLITLFAAVRLAKFNVDEEQKNSFKGLPTPAAALFIVSIPMVLLIEPWGIRNYIMNRYVLFAIVIVTAYLQVSHIRMFSMKFPNFGWKGNEIRYGYLGFIVLSGIVSSWLNCLWLGFPLSIAAYVLLSMFLNAINYEV